MSRGSKGVFSRDNYSSEESKPSSKPQSDWLNEFDAQLKKQSTQPAHKDRALFEQISDILGTKSRYATVEEAVSDMQERTGLATYIKMVEADKAAKKSTASEQPKEESSAQDELEVRIDPSTDEVAIPKLLQDHPEIRTVIEQFVQSRRGHPHIQAVIEFIQPKFRNSGITSDEFEDKHLRKFINEIIIREKAKHNQEEAEISVELGKLDQSSSSEEDNNDAFSLLMPASN